MVLSFSKKFIFIKTRKTAGTSVEIALSKYCNERDVLTPISPQDESIRKNLYQVSANNYEWQWPLLPVYLFRDMVHLPEKYIRWVFRHKQMPDLKLKFYNHIPAYRLRFLLGSEIWNQYFKFSVERNPWDKAISRYYWDRARGKVKPDQKFDDYIEHLSKVSPGRLSNWHLYSYGDEIIVDKVIQYENLDNELNATGALFGIHDLSLPSYKAKSGIRNKNTDDEDLMSDRAKEIIYEVCNKEISKFRYKCNWN